MGNKALMVFHFNNRKSTHILKWHGMSKMVETKKQNVNITVKYVNVISNLA